MALKHWVTQALALIALAPILASPAKAVRNPPALRGLNSVTLEVNSFGGVPIPEIKSRLVTDLLDAGIRVLRPHAAGAPDTPHLRVTLTLACSDESCGYTVRLQLNEPVQQVREPRITLVVPIWDDSYQNAISKSDLVAMPDIYLAESRALMMNFIDDIRRGESSRP